MAIPIELITKSQRELEQTKLGLNTTALDRDEAISLELRDKLYLELKTSGGYAPTRRDSNGNILLYEDPLIEGGGYQLRQADQLVTIELIKPDYDDAQAKEVLDIEIDELYTKTDRTEIAKLRTQVEDLRQQLLQIVISGSADGIDGEVGDRYVDPELFVPVNYFLPDLDSGVDSATPLMVNITTGIFNEENMILDHIGSADPISVNWWLVDGETGKIYKQGVNNTFIGGIGNSDDIPKDIILDVILKLTGVASNFNGWFVVDQSFGINNYVRFSAEDIVRFTLLPRKETGFETVDRFRNTYDIIVSFLNVAPTITSTPNVNVVSVNINTAKVVYDVIGTLGLSSTVRTAVREFDMFNNVINVGTVAAPASVQAFSGNRINLKVLATRLVDENNDVIVFNGWYKKNSATNEYDKISSNDVLEFALLNQDVFDVIAGFRSIDDIGTPSDDESDIPSLPPDTPDTGDSGDTEIVDSRRFRR